MLSGIKRTVKRIWAKTPASLALVALATSTLVALDAPIKAEAVGSTSCGTTNTYTVSNGYCTVTFTTTGADTWTVPTNVDKIDILAVGGGGASNRGICSYTYGAGGGGGGFLEITNQAVTSGAIFDINVGAGGVGTSGACQYLGVNATSPQGGTSSVVVRSATGTGPSVYAYGGYGARQKSNDTGGGNQGNTLINGVSAAGNIAGSPAWDTSGNCTQTGCASGGGGGAGGAGSGMNAGAARLSAITGAYYGAGGVGDRDTSSGTQATRGTTVGASCSGAANTGAGGSDCLPTNAGGSGGSGIVVIRWLANPNVTLQPIDASITVGANSTATFSTSAIAASSLPSPTVSYQWEQSTDGGTTWASVTTGSGGTTKTYTTAAQTDTTANGYKYRALITESGGGLSRSIYSNVVTLSVGNTGVDAPTGILATGGGNAGEMILGWTAPVAPAGKTITGYQVQWSATADFANPTLVNFATADTFAAVQSLTASTTYYFKVAATGAGWTGTNSAVVSGTTKASTVQIYIQATSTAVAGVDYVTVGGAIVPKTATTLYLTPAMVQNLLANGNVLLGGYFIYVNAPMSWSANSVLYFGRNNASIFVNAPITITGDTGGISTGNSTFTFGAGYAVKPKISLTGANPYVWIYQSKYTVIKSEAELVALSSQTTNIVLGVDIALTSTYSNYVKNWVYAARFEGMNNTISGMKINVTAAGNVGFFKQLGITSSVRNVYFTNVAITSSVAGIDKRIGVVAGQAAATGGSTALSGVWADGFITETATTGQSEIGGLVGNVSGGSVTFQSDAAAVNITSSAPTAVIGGILGSNTTAINTVDATAGTIYMNQTWSSGDLYRKSSTSTAPIGGLVGFQGNTADISVSYSTGKFKTDANAGTNMGGIIGRANGTTTATVGNSYTAYSSCGGGTITNCTTGANQGTQVAGAVSPFVKTAALGTYVGSGFRPKKYFYVQVIAPTDSKYATIGTKILNGLGEEVLDADLTALNVGKSGTPTFDTVTSNSATGTYSVKYAGGLTVTGTPSAVFEFAPWPTATSISLIGPQTITWTSTAPTNAKYGGSYTPSATTDAGLTVAFTIDLASSSVCSIANGVVSFIGPGTCTIKANQAGNSTYGPAGESTQSFTVSQATKTVAFNSTAPSSAVVNGLTYTPTGSTSNGDSVTFSIASGSSAVCSITNGIVSFQGVGSCVVQADSATTTNYAAAETVTQSFTVGKGTQTISFTSSLPVSPKVGTSYSVSATATSGSSVTFTTTSTSCSINGNTVSFLSVGDCVIKADQLGNDNWNAAAQVTQTLTVIRGDRAITFTSTATAPQVGTTYTPAATVSGTGSVSFAIADASSSTCSILNGVVSFLSVGECTIIGTTLVTDNWNAPAQATQTITVLKGEQTVAFTTTAPNQPKVGSFYTPGAIATGGSDATFTIDSSSSAICSVSNGVISFSAVGDCVLLANAAGNPNYNAAPAVSQTINVIKGEQNITFSSSVPSGARIGDANYNYTPIAAGGASTSPVVFAIASGSSSVCHITAGVVTFDSPGDCVVEASQAGDSNFNAAPPVTQTISVGKGLNALSWSASAPTNAVVDGSAFTPLAASAVSPANIVYSIASSSSSVCTLTNGSVTFQTVGDCVVRANQGATSMWEAASEIAMTISVGKGTQTVSYTTTAPNGAIVSGATYTPAATGGATGHAVIFRIDLSAASVCAIQSGVVRFIGVGTCVVNANQVGDANYENAAQVQQSFNVGKGNQAILFTTTAPVSSSVGSAAYSPAATGGLSGNAVVFTVANSSSTICNLVAGKVSYLAPGDCVIEANQAGNTNYNAASVATQTISVSKGNQAIAFNSSFSSAKVGGPTYLPVATGGASGNAVSFQVATESSSICSISNGSVSFTAVGDCVLEANQAGNANFNAATVATQTIAVAKGTQVVQFTSNPPHNVQVQGASYTPTALGSASGIPVVFSIPLSAQTYCTISNGVISFHAVGNCVLYADQAGDSNWNAATRVTQVFDVTKGQQVVTITSSAPTAAKVSGSTYSLTATGGSGSAPVTFSISELATDICSVSGSTVSFNAPGNCVVVASQAGDSQFNAANPVTQSFAVAKGTQALAFSSNPNNPTVDGLPYSPVVTAGGGSASVVFSTADSTVCDIGNNGVIFHKASDCVVYANQAGDARFEAAPQITQTFSVAKGLQASLVGQGSVTTLTLGQNNVPTAVLTVSGGSGTGQYGWAVNSSNTNICSIVDDVVTGLAVGYCNIDLIRAGDSNYLEKTGTMQLVISSGSQLPVLASISRANVVFERNLTLQLSLTGGAGEGAVWFESSTPHVCNTDGDSALQILHAGTCSVVGHKDGDGNYQSAQSTVTFEIAKATQTDVNVELQTSLRFSTTSETSSPLIVSGVQSTGSKTFSVTNGNCTINNGNLVASSAGSCEIRLDVSADEDFEAFTTSSTFEIAKSLQSALAATRSPEAPELISYVGVKTTIYEITGGSGTGILTVSVGDSSICSASINNTVVTVTGISAGSCVVTVVSAADSNYESAQTEFTVTVVSLPSAPTGVTLSNTGTNTADGMRVIVSWNAPSSNAGIAPVSGYEIQSKSGTNWVTVTDGIVAADVTSLNIYVPAWSSMLIRIAPISTVDPSDSTLRHWASYTGGNQNNNAVAFQVPGALQLISTSVAAISSGEVVTLTGTGFEAGVTTSVELSSSSQVFTPARVGAAAVTPVNRVTLPATVISPTQLTFVLPKVKLPAGVSSLPTQVKVLSNTGIASAPASFSYIPKKLPQTLVMNGTLPAASTVANVGSLLTTNATFTSTTISPVITATPGVCSATLNGQGKLVITPIAPGKCTVTVGLPATPGYLASSVKTASVIVKQSRTTGFQVTLRGVNSDGTLGNEQVFGSETAIVPGVVNVSLGENPIDLPVALSSREGTLLFTVTPADEAAGLCTADPGDATSGLQGSITVSAPGDCHVTISQPADAGWYLGETLKLTIHTTERVVDPNAPQPQDTGDGTASPEDTDTNPLDADTEPAVAVSLDASSAADYSFGTEDGLGFDPIAGKFTVRSRTALVGTWTATLSSPDLTKKWFKLPGKVVKKVQQYTLSNVCKLTLTVKKDPKLKKRVTRVIGAGCLLSDTGKAALTATGIQKIKVKYKRIRQYANTGLSYVKTKGNRVLKNINRTWVIRIGR